MLITCLVSIFVMTGQVYALQEPPTTFVDEKVYDTDIKKLRESITALKNTNEEQNKAIVEINIKVSEIQKRIAENDVALQKKMIDVSQTASEAQNRITGLGELLVHRTFQLSLGTVLAGLIAIAGLLLAFLVRKRYVDGSASLESRIAQMREQLNDE